MHVKMVDMALSPQESKAETAMPAPDAKPAGPMYPYGLCVRLGKDELAKLGLAGGLPEVGEMISFDAIAKVTSASMHESVNADGSKNSSECIELQITQMGVAGDEGEAAEAEGAQRQARRDRFYKRGDKAE